MDLSGWPYRPSAVPAAPTTFRLGYQPTLDGLRAIAIVLVLLYHSGVISWGFLGVDLFFALSGYLITSLLLDERTIDLRQFYLRRCLRIMPALYAVVVATALLTWFTPLVPADAEPAGFARLALGTIFFAANWVRIYLPSPSFVMLGQMWSLAVEEHFYLVWPGIVYLLRRRWPERITPLLAATLLGIAVSIATMFLHEGKRVYMGSDTRAHTLLFGCLAAQLQRLYPRTCEAWARPMLAIAGAGIVGVLAVRASLPRLQYPIFAVSCSLAIVSVVARRTSVITPFLAAPPTVMLGRLSYGIYLWHMIAAVWIDHIPGLEQMPYEGALRFALMLGSGILLAAASRRCPMCQRRLRQSLPDIFVPMGGEWFSKRAEVTPCS